MCQAKEIDVYKIEALITLHEYNIKIYKSLIITNCFDFDNFDEDLSFFLY